MDDRIVRAKLDILQGLAVKRSIAIEGWQAQTAEFVGPKNYKILSNWQPVAQPHRWKALQTIFMETAVEVPADWDVENTFIAFGFSEMEGLLRVNGEAWSGIDWAHTRCPVPVGGTLKLEVEFDSVPRAKCEQHMRDNECTFSGAQLIEVDREVEAAFYDFRFAYEAEHVIVDERRRKLVEMALEEAMLTFPTTGPREVIVKEVAEARKILADQLAQIAPDPEGGRIALTGHTHIDTAWLWQIKETIRKCGRTFSTANWMMRRYPDYHFSCSQAQLYDYTQKYYPEVDTRLQELVTEGRWETTGGMWVEADCNVASGEALIRQFLYGIRYFEEQYGTRPTICWLPDVFGYNAGMPQILKGCGIDNFWTWKLHWQSNNPFPYHLFWWEGVDGSQVMAHIPKLGGGAYNGDPTPQQLVTAWQTYLQKAEYDEELMPFGYGDGGGGVSEIMIEYAGRAERFPGLPACRQVTAEQFFADVREVNPDLPTWVGELYLETHRGTYTSQSHIKKANRQCELALRGAEISATMARMLGVTVDTTPLKEAWELLLLHQFHDILPGSSIGEVYVDSAEDHARVLETARQVREAAIRPLMGHAEDTFRYAILNSLSWVRNGVVEMDIPDLGPNLTGVMGGEEVPVQVISREGERAKALVATKNVPAMGGTLLELSAEGVLASSIAVAQDYMENDFFCLRINAEGEIVSLWDKYEEREVIAENATGNALQLFQDGPEREAAWNVHKTFEKRQYAWDSTSVKVIEQGPVRGIVQIEKRIGDTILVQDITLFCHVPRIDFHTKVNWQERQTMLKVAFPVAIHSDKAAFEVQFGVIDRATHTNTSWEQEKFEVCAQRWVDISEGGYGVSLLNDCKYGHDIRGNVLRMTLLRGPQWPDPDCDLGDHEFTYSLYPHAGDWRQAKTVQRGWELNVPMFCIETAQQRPPTSLVQIDGPAILEALKPAEDGNGAILRVYEPNGSRGKVKVKFLPKLNQVIACNMVEEGEEIIATGSEFEFSIKPFEVKTFRIT